MLKRGGRGRRSASHKVSLLGKGPSDSKRQGQMSTGMQRMLGGRVGLLGNTPADNINSGLYQDAQGYNQNYQEGDNYKQYPMEDDSGYLDDRNVDRMPLQYDRSQPQSLLGQGNIQPRSLLDNFGTGQNVPFSQSNDVYYEEDYGNQGYSGDQGGQDWGGGNDQYGVDYGQGTQQHRGGSLLDAPVQQQRRRGLLDSSIQPHREDFKDSIQQRRGRGLLDAPSQQGGFQDSMQQRRVGGLLDAPMQQNDFQDAFQQGRGGGLLDTPMQQGGFQDTIQQHRGGGLLDAPVQQDFGYSDILDDDRNSYGGNSMQGRGFGGSQDIRYQDSQDSLLGQPNIGMDQGFQQNQRSFGRQQRMDRQVDLLQKADLQIRMIEEEKIEQKRRQQEMMQPDAMDGQGMSREMRALLETQKRALMLQQREKIGRKGEGLLGDRPSGQQNMGQQSSGQRRGSLPSLFDIGGGQRRTLLGKRPSATQTRAAQVAKRARQESQISRNKPISKSRQSPPRQRGTKRGSSRRLRRDDDRKDSAKDSHRSPSKQNSSGSPRKDQDRSRRESKNEKVTKETTKVVVTAGNKHDSPRPTKEGQQKKNDDDDVQITGVEEASNKSGKQDQIKTEKKDAGKEGEEKDKTRDKLTVTVSKKGRSVNDSDAKPEEPETAPHRYRCNVCDVKCYDESSFSRHMKGIKHSKKMELLASKTSETTPVIAARKKAEEHLKQIETKHTSSSGKSSTQRKALESHCKVCDEKFSGAYKDHKEAPKHQARENRSKAGCKTCGVSTFLSYQDFMKHLDSDWHKKKLKQESWPECKTCNQKFKSPRKFVLHCKTDHHIENKKKKGETDDDLDDLKDLVTLDTVGFEEENTTNSTSAASNKEPEKKKESTTSQKKEPAPVPAKTASPKVTKETKVEETKTSQTKEAPRKSIEEEEEVLGDYNPDVAVGQRFVVPVSGFFCKLCHKFYNNESAAKGTHCQSQTHFEKYQKIVIAKMMNKRLTEEALAKPVAKQEYKAVSLEKITLEENKIAQGNKQENSDQVDNSKQTEKLAGNNTDKGDNQENGTDKNSHSSNTTNNTEHMDTGETDNKEGEDEIRIDVYPESMDSLKKGSPARARRGRGRGGVRK